MDKRSSIDGLLEMAVKPLTTAVRLFFGTAFEPHFEDEVMPQWLQAVAYIDEHDLFVLDSGSLGFAFIGSPMSGVDASMADKLGGVLQTQMPNDTVLQFALWTSPDMEQSLGSYAITRHDANGAFLQGLRDEFIDFFRQGTASSVIKGQDVRLRDAKLIVTGKVPFRGEFGPDEIAKVTELRDVIHAGLNACGLRLSRMKSSTYLRVMQTVFNWSPSAAWRKAAESEPNPDLPLTSQILDYDTDVSIDTKGMTFGDRHVTVMSPKYYPSRGWFGMAYAFLGEVMSGSRGLREPTWMCLNLWFRDREAEAASISRESTWITHQASTPLARFTPQLADQKRSFDLAVAQIGQGDRIVRMQFGMALFSASHDDAIAASANARAYMREFGFQLLADSFAVAPIFASLMPFGTDVGSAKVMQRFRRTTSRAVVGMLPIMSEWRGTGSPLLPMVSRNGQLMMVSNWDSDTNYNIAIAAESGSGKSFLGQDLIVNGLMQGERFWVVDKGKSYRNLCEQVGGMRMTFGKDSKLCLNPFSIVSDYEEDEDLLVSLVTSMAALTEPLSDLQAAELKKIMRFGWDKLGSEKMCIDAIAALCIKHPDNRIQDVGRQLYPFTREGSYGRLFYGKNNYEANNPLILLELDDLEGRTHLQRVVLLQLMFQIRREMGRLPRGLHKYLMIDEAWEILASGSVGSSDADPVADFIGKAYRQFRKLGGAAITITQSVSDFFINNVTRAIYENSANKWLLGQRSESVESSRQSGRLDLGDHGIKLLKSVHTVPGEYSEVFLYTPGGYGVGRVITPHVTRKLFSTRPSDIEDIARLRSQGVSLMDAARQLSASDANAMSVVKGEAR